jgi:hypothetical protein
MEALLQAFLNLVLIEVQWSASGASHTLLPQCTDRVDEPQSWFGRFGKMENFFAFAWNRTTIFVSCTPSQYWLRYPFWETTENIATVIKHPVHLALKVIYVSTTPRVEFASRFRHILRLPSSG